MDICMLSLVEDEFPRPILDQRQLKGLLASAQVLESLNKLPQTEGPVKRSGLREAACLAASPSVYNHYHLPAHQTRTDTDKSHVTRHSYTQASEFNAAVYNIC